MLYVYAIIVAMGEIVGMTGLLMKTHEECVKEFAQLKPNTVYKVIDGRDVAISAPWICIETRERPYLGQRVDLFTN